MTLSIRLLAISAIVASHLPLMPAVLTLPRKMTK